MSHWAFVAAAYAVALAGTIGLLAQSFAAMRGAEAEADSLKDRR